MIAGPEETRENKINKKAEKWLIKSIHAQKAA